MIKYSKHVLAVIVSLVVYIGFGFTHYTTPSTIASQEKIPPLEIYVIDIEDIPQATGEKGSTYTAQVFIVENNNREVIGPFRGSSYPNSKEIPEGSDKPNTVVAGSHIFNNKHGHKGGTVKGLNLINSNEERIVPGYSWTRQPSLVKYANIHSGFSDNGNFNSRGSMGCITIHPQDVNDFWEHFDFSDMTKGNATGVVYIYRNNQEKRQQLIEQIKRIYLNL